MLNFGLTVDTLDRTVLPEHGFFADLNLEWTDETVATSFKSQKSTLYVFIGPVL